MLTDPAGGDTLSAFSAPPSLTCSSPPESDELADDDELAGEEARSFSFLCDRVPSSSSWSTSSSPLFFFAEEPSRRFRFFLSFRLRLW